eukprot:CAMPEP_0119312858 /NCGR_PEP_ID=MMETSP1333-20130426/27052_1 /TAXON_ID=418940 /ORGANISM="Scyphosphaera apsteinii, Strain RCC1455" /LENGTH=310 /DNA_ID=CAMNT_0007317535 /DNA_START=37 /DNA_END=970 /DNA_ORIENTATION=+
MTFALVTCIGALVTDGAFAQSRRTAKKYLSRSSLRPDVQLSIRPQFGEMFSKTVFGRRMSSPPLSVWKTQAGVMFVASSFLGPLCDGRHSAHDVLHYSATGIAGAPLILKSPNGHILLETCWWVPPAFGLAGIILGTAHPLLDRLNGVPRPTPGWPATLLCIACFVGSYELSGVLAEAAASSTHDFMTLDLPLLLSAACIFLAFERSAGGLFMCALLFVIGPLVEIGLINVLHLYAYTHPDLYGVPSWIPQVYAAGGPAVGALGRKVLDELALRAENAEELGQGNLQRLALLNKNGQLHLNCPMAPKVAK